MKAGWFRKMQGWFWAKVRLDLGKHWNIFKMGLLVCFMSIPAWAYMTDIINGRLYILMVITQNGYEYKL